MKNNLNLEERINKIKIVLGKIPPEKLLIGFIIISVALFLLYDSLIAKPLKRLKAVELQLASGQKLSKAHEGLIRDYAALKSDRESKEQDFNRFKDKFVNEEQLPNYFDNFRALVKSYNLRVETLEFKPQEILSDEDKGSVGCQKIPLEVTLRGSYFNLIVFLRRLESGNPLFDILSVSMRQEDSSSFDTTMDIKSNIYILTTPIKK